MIFKNKSDGKDIWINKDLIAYIKDDKDLGVSVGIIGNGFIAVEGTFIEVLDMVEG